MTKIKRWIFERFLPSYYTASMNEEYVKLRAAVLESEQRIKELNAYIEGLELAVKAIKRITIHNEVK